MPFAANNYPLNLSTLVGNDFSITSSSKTQLSITLQVDAELLKKRAMIPAIIIPIIVLPCTLFMSFAAESQSTRYTTRGPDITVPIFIFAILLVFCICGIIFGLLSSQAKKKRSFQLVLDKPMNKMTIQVPNPYANNGKHPRSYFARLGEFFTRTWSLDEISFRLVSPEDKLVRKNPLDRKFLKYSWLVMFGDRTWFNSAILLDSENAELAQSLMHTIDDFLGDNANSSNDQDDGPLSERSSSS